MYTKDNVYHLNFKGGMTHDSNQAGSDGNVGTNTGG